MGYGQAEPCGPFASAAMAIARQGTHCRPQEMHDMMQHLASVQCDVSSAMAILAANMQPAAAAASRPPHTHRVAAPGAPRRGMAIAEVDEGAHADLQLTLNPHGGGPRNSASSSSDDVGESISARGSFSGATRDPRQEVLADPGNPQHERHSVVGPSTGLAASTQPGSRYRAAPTVHWQAAVSEAAAQHARSVKRVSICAASASTDTTTGGHDVAAGDAPSPQKASNARLAAWNHASQLASASLREQPDGGKPANLSSTSGVSTTLNSPKPAASDLLERSIAAFRQAAAPRAATAGAMQARLRLYERLASHKQHQAESAAVSSRGSNSATANTVPPSQTPKNVSQEQVALIAAPGAPAATAGAGDGAAVIPAQGESNGQEAPESTGSAGKRPHLQSAEGPNTSSKWKSAIILGVRSLRSGDLTVRGDPTVQTAPLGSPLTTSPGQTNLSNASKGSFAARQSLGDAYRRAWSGVSARAVRNQTSSLDKSSPQTAGNVSGRAKTSNGLETPGSGSDNQIKAVSGEADGDAPEPTQAVLQAGQALSEPPVPRITLQKLFWDVLTVKDDPDSGIRATWDFCILFMMLIVMIHVPYTVSFPEDELFSNWFWFSTAVDIVFVVDMYQQTRCSYIDEDFLEVTDRWKIVKTYLSGWFIIDALSTIPFDIILDARGGSFLHLTRSTKLTKITKMLRLTKMLKLLRLVRANTLINRIQDTIGRAASNLVRITGLSILMLHVIACMFHFLGTIALEDDGGVFEIGALGRTSWLHDEGLEDEGTGLRYLIALYWSACTLSTVGYGDVTPGSSAEIVLSMFTMVLGLSVFSYFLTAVAQTVKTINAEQIRISEALEEAELLVRTRGFTSHLARRIKKYFQYCAEEKILDRDLVMLNQLSHQLQQDVQLFMYTSLIANVPFIQSKGPAFILELVQVLTLTVVAPREFVVIEGERCTCMFFVYEGELEMVRAIDRRKFTRALLKARMRLVTRASTPQAPRSRSWLRMLSPTRVTTTLKKRWKQPPRRKAFAPRMLAKLFSNDAKYNDTADTAIDMVSSELYEIIPPLLKHGHHFGEDACLSKAQRSETSVVTREFSKLLKLEASDLEALVELFGGDEDFDEDATSDEEDEDDEDDGDKDDGDEGSIRGSRSMTARTGGGRVEASSAENVLMPSTLDTGAVMLEPIEEASSLPVATLRQSVSAKRSSKMSSSLALNRSSASISRSQGARHSSSVSVNEQPHQYGLLVPEPRTSSSSDGDSVAVHAMSGSCRTSDCDDACAGPYGRRSASAGPVFDHLKPNPTFRQAAGSDEASYSPWMFSSGSASDLPSPQWPVSAGTLSRPATGMWKSLAREQEALDVRDRLAPLLPHALLPNSSWSTHEEREGRSQRVAFGRGGLDRPHEGRYSAVEGRCSVETRHEGRYSGAVVDPSSPVVPLARPSISLSRKSTYGAPRVRSTSLPGGPRSSRAAMIVHTQKTLTEDRDGLLRLFSKKQRRASRAHDIP